MIEPMLPILAILVISLAAAQGQTLTVTLLGSGGGPPPNLERFGPSTLVEAGDQKLLFDAGRGTILQLRRLNIPYITRLFLTHLHPHLRASGPLAFPMAGARNPSSENLGAERHERHDEGL